VESATIGASSEWYLSHSEGHSHSLFWKLWRLRCGYVWPLTRGKKGKRCSWHHIL